MRAAERQAIFKERVMEKGMEKRVKVPVTRISKNGGSAGREAEEINKAR